jgi:hypothetical protein
MLHLFKNGELVFESKTAEQLLDETTSLFKRRQEARDDISVIDTASAILSQTGGRAFSLKSDYIENMSIKTPGTHFSSRKSTISTLSPDVRQRGFGHLRG